MLKNYKEAENTCQVVKENNLVWWNIPGGQARNANGRGAAMNRENIDAGKLDENAWRDILVRETW
jgi:hypothetical protein